MRELSEAHKFGETMTQVEMRAALIRIDKSKRLATECIAVIDPFGATQKIPKVNARSIEVRVTL